VLQATVEPSRLGLLTLSAVRGYLRRSHAVGLAVFIGVAYALGSMIIGGMLIFARLSGGYTVLIFWGNALGLQTWNYPLLVVAAPWGFIELPFFATFSMVFVSAGVGLGMAVAIVLGVQLIRERKSSAGRPAATGTIAGLTPAMIALVTLGACCSTTAAATAGVGLVAQSSGTSGSNLLYNNWYLGLFQMVVVYVALIAQELLLRVYGKVFGANDPAFAPSTRPAAKPFTRRTFAAGLLRAGLLAGGVTWLLAVVAAWTTTDPSSASAALWFTWVVDHGLIGGFAVLAALSPSTALRAVNGFGAKTSGVAIRGALIIGAWTLGAWVPPPLAGAGVEGFGNELLGAMGVGASWGGVPPVFSWGLALVLRWAFQYLLLAGFAAAVAVAPVATLTWVDDSRPTAGNVVRADSPTPTASLMPSNAR